MKTVSAGLTTHLAQTVTTLATLWRLTREDGVNFYFTDHDVSIPFDDGDGLQTYTAESGYNRTAISNTSTLAVDNLDLEGVFNSASITENDLRAGLFDYAEVKVHVVNWSDLPQGSLKVRRGRLGEVLLTPQGFFRTELRGLTQALSQTIGEVYQAECRADLGDSRCKVPIRPDLRLDSNVYELGEYIRVVTDGTPNGTESDFENRIYEVTTAGTSDSSPPTFDTVVGNTTADNTVTWTAREAWTRHGIVDTVTSRTVFTLTVAFDETRAVDDWFNGGQLTFESGANSGRAIEVRDWTQASRTVTLFLSTPFAIAPGDLVRLYAGCDKRLTTCINKFVIPGSLDFANGNVKNFRGEPFIPGQDELVRFPDAKT